MTESKNTTPEQPVYMQLTKNDLIERISNVANIIEERSTRGSRSSAGTCCPLFDMPHSVVAEWPLEKRTLFENLCAMASNGVIYTGSIGADLYEWCDKYVRTHDKCKFEETYYYQMIKPIANLLL